jgi:hypothetical protein
MIKLADGLERLHEFRVHPLGFYYLQNDLGDGIVHRLHVWTEQGLNAPDKDRHSHAYDIESKVVIGAIRSEVFDFRETPEGLDVEFLVGYDGTKSTLAATGRRGVLVPVVAFETSATCRYRLEAGVVHRVTVMQRPCVTIFSTRDRGLPIHSYGDGESERPFSRNNVSVEERGAIAVALRQALKDSTAD